MSDIDFEKHAKEISLIGVISLFRDDREIPRNKSQFGTKIVTQPYNGELF